MKPSIIYDAVRSCRICHRHDTKLLKYDVRHYAHTDCYLKRHGFDGLLALPVGALSQVRIGALTKEQLRKVMARFEGEALEARLANDRGGR